MPLYEADGITQLTGDVTAGPGNGSQSSSLVAASNSTLATLSKSTGVAVHGTNTNDSASSGYVGEFLSQNVGSNTSPAASGTPSTVISLNLTAGDWDVEGTLALSTGSATTLTFIITGISTTTNAFDSSTSGGYFSLPFSSSVTASAPISIPTGPRRISLAASATVYLVGQLSYGAVGTMVYTTGTIIRARRVR